MISVHVLPVLLLGWALPPEQGDPATRPSAFEIATAVETVVSDAIAKAEPSVVAIHRQKNEASPETLAVRGRKEILDVQDLQLADLRSPGTPDPELLLSFDYGSGVVIGNEGQILTAFHVVRGARTLVVRAADRQSFWAEVIAADPRSDLAVIAPKVVAGKPGPRLKPIVIGDASTLRKGSFLMVLGNPFNAARDGKPSAGSGILSNFARRLNFRDEETGRVRDDLLLSFPTLLQLDAKLNLGMSGGAVINLKGELVGLTTMAASTMGFDSQAGYALPMDKMGRRAVELLEQGLEVEYGLLGIEPDSPMTNVIRHTQPGKPAELAGLLVRDEIIAVDDRPVRDFDSLILAINGQRPGDVVRLKVRRNGEVLDKELELAKYPVRGEIIATNLPKPWRGLRVAYETNSSMFRGEVDPLKMLIPGVTVTSVEDGSPAAVAGIKKGHLIRKVGSAATPTPRKFADAVAGLEGAVTLDTDTGPISVPSGSK
jgi:serine protease Do